MFRHDLFYTIIQGVVISTSWSNMTSWFVDSTLSLLYYSLQHLSLFLNILIGTGRVLISMAKFAPSTICWWYYVICKVNSWISNHVRRAKPSRKKVWLKMNMDKTKVLFNQDCVAEDIEIENVTRVCKWICIFKKKDSPKQ